MAVPTEVSKSALTFEPDIFRKNAFLQLPQNQHDGIFGFTSVVVFAVNGLHPEHVLACTSDLPKSLQPGAHH